MNTKWLTARYAVLQIAYWALTAPSADMPPYF